MPKDTYWSLDSSTMFIDKKDGINEAGLTVAMSTVWTKQFKPGVNWFTAVRAVVDKCSSVSEATKFL